MFVWTVHLEGGPRRVNHAAVAIEEKIYSFGGYCTGEDYETTRPMDVHILDSISYRWKSLPIPNRKEPQCSDVPYQRYGHTAVAYKHCAYIWGGRNDSQGACNILYCFDTVLLKWSKVSVTGTIPGARDGHSACVLNHKMYIFGGYEEWVAEYQIVVVNDGLIFPLLDRFSNEVHSFDFATKTWTGLKTAGAPAQWRDFQSGSAIGDTMYIFGGRSDKAGPWHTNNEVYCNKIQAFRSTTQNWFEPETSGQAPFGRRSHSAFVHNGMIYIFGGYNGLHDLHFNDLYRFNAETSEWSLVKVKGKGPCPRRRQCCCVIKDRIFLFGGTSPCTNTMEGTEFNLMDHSDLYVLDMAPSLKTLCQLVVLEHNLDPSNLPHDIRWELTAMTTNNTISRPLNTSG